MRELKVGEEVMVIDMAGEMSSKYFSIGEIVKITSANDDYDFKGVVSPNYIGHVKREHRACLLAIDDRVKRGKDWMPLGPTNLATISGLKPNRAVADWDNACAGIEVDMSPTCQKLAHADEEESKPEYGVSIADQVLEAAAELKRMRGDITEEDTMDTRKERIRTTEDDIERREEAILVGKANLADVKAELALLKKYPTDRAQVEGEAAIKKDKHIKAIKEAKGCSPAKAKAIYELGVLEDRIKV